MPVRCYPCPRHEQAPREGVGWLPLDRIPASPAAGFSDELQIANCPFSNLTDRTEGRWYEGHNQSATTEKDQKRSLSKSVRSRKRKPRPTTSSSGRANNGGVADRRAAK